MFTWLIRADASANKTHVFFQTFIVDCKYYAVSISTHFFRLSSLSWRGPPRATKKNQALFKFARVSGKTNTDRQNYFQIQFRDCITEDITFRIFLLNTISNTSDQVGLQSYLLSFKSLCILINLHLDGEFLWEALINCMVQSNSCSQCQRFYRETH